MITKEQAEKANAAILSTFKTYGVREVEGKLYPYELETDYGMLFITPRIDAGEQIASVFMKFDVLNWDKKALEKQLGKKAFNPFTGKWNIHCDHPLGIVEAFELNMMLLDISPDLFNNLEAMPSDLREIVDHYADIADELTYDQCAQFLEAVEAIGYTFEYYLDAVPYNLRKKEE